MNEVRIPGALIEKQASNGRPSPRSKSVKGLTVAEERRLKRLRSRKWRLDHLYWILNKEGETVKFSMKAVQQDLYRTMWWLNVIPKSRRHGITTFICLFILDACLFNSNTRAGIIAHTLDSAKKFLRDIILFAYDRLPEDLKAARPLLKRDSQEIIIGHTGYNKSSIYVSTSMRSGTLQYLHVSEYGKLCARMPIKAREVKTGAMPTVHKGGFIFVESTAEGPFGDFYDMCIEAQGNENKEMSRLDWKCHFYGWMDDPDNVIDTPVEIPSEVNDYLDGIEKIYDKRLTLNQRAWYALMKRRFKHDMYKEYPSTVEECFMAAVEGAYFPTEISQMREAGRIGSIPHVSGELVHTVCDLGVGSHMPWLFFQLIGKEIHIINCFNLPDREDSIGGAVAYRGMLDDFRRKYHYQYGKHFSPHDAHKREIGSGDTIFKTFAKAGIVFTKLERETSVFVGIERMRQMLDVTYIDAEKCKEVIKAWTAYHREWNEALDCFVEKPKNDHSAHYADAGRYLSWVIQKNLCGSKSLISLAKARLLAKKYRRVG